MSRLLLVLILLGAACRAEEEKGAGSKLPPLTAERFVAFQLALHRTKYPILFGELFDKLGGNQTMAESWEHSNGRGVEKFRDFLYYTIGRSPSSLGVYQIEFEFGVLSDDRQKDPVIRARLCFRSPFGALFYADDVGRDFGDEESKGKGADKAPLQTPASVTPAGDPPGAPPSGAAGL